MQFKLFKDAYSGEIRTDQIKQILDDGTVLWVPNDERNSHWREYQEWLAQGNQPQPPDEPEG